MKLTHLDIPSDFPVRPISPLNPAKDYATCETCGLGWDDAIATEYTPAPGGRCPFEAFHKDAPVAAQVAVVGLHAAGTLPAKIFTSLAQDIRERVGLQNEWDNIDLATMRELRQTWEGIITEAIKAVSDDVLAQAAADVDTAAPIAEFEWSMGNGQCPYCYGLSPDKFSGFGGYDTRDKGHERDCALAATMRLAGFKTVMQP
jgi:hypothetical protein